MRRNTAAENTAAAIRAGLTTHDTGTVPMHLHLTATSITTADGRTRPVILHVPTVGTFRPADAGQPTLEDVARYVRGTRSPIYVCDGLGNVFGRLGRGGWEAGHTIHVETQRQVALAVADASVNGCAVPGFPVTFPA